MTVLLHRLSLTVDYTPTPSVPSLIAVIIRFNQASLHLYHRLTVPKNLDPPRSF